MNYLYKTKKNEGRVSIILILCIFVFFSLGKIGFSGENPNNELLVQKKIQVSVEEFSVNGITNPQEDSMFLTEGEDKIDDVEKEVESKGNSYGFTFPESVIKGRAIGAYTGLGVYAIGSVLVYNYIWYKDMEWTRFHFYNDNKDWLQMDKHGHMFSAYHQTRYAYNLFRWIGYSKKTSLWVSAGISTFIQFQVELWDGFFEGYGFSYGDIVANTLGTTLFAVQEALWDDQLFKLKFSYFPSKYRKISPDHLGSTPFKGLFYDYNAHTQWISGSLRKLTGIEALPSWLCISVGFSTNGVLKEIDNSGIPGYEDYPRYRQTFLSLDVDLSGLRPRNPFLRGLIFFANMIKFPAPALEYNKIDGLKFRALYF